MRDKILGHIPHSTLNDWRYLAVAGLAGVLVFLWYGRVVNHGRFFTAFDAVGLSIFTVTVTTVALYAGLSPAPAALLGILTGTVTVTISPYNANPLYGPVAQFSTSPYSQKSFTLTAGGHASAVISVYSCRATPSGQWSFTLSVTFGAPATLTSFTDIVSGTGRYSCPLAPSP